jgi:hypothetical protein
MDCCCASRVHQALLTASTLCSPSFCHPTRARQLLNHPRLLAALHLRTAPPIEVALRAAEERAAARLEVSRSSGLPQEVRGSRKGRKRAGGK